MPRTKEWLIIQNDGELDLRLLELMGASTKDGDSTIGMFGTGWKYGLALALRKKMDVMVFAGKQMIEFSRMPEKIRGTIFNRISYSINGKRRRKTSMTTLLGQADWSDEWMFLREVIANAFDEGGFRLETLDVDDDSPCGVKDTTRVYMSVTPRIREILNDMEFFVRRHGELEENSYGKVFKPLGDKCRVYKRGIFVKELEQTGLYDYDLTNLKLTESRSADSWDIQREMKETLTHASVEVRRNVLASIEKTEGDSTNLVEGDLSFYDWESASQQAWSEAFSEEYGEEAVLCEGSNVVVESLKNMGRRAVTLPEKVAQVLRNGKKVLTEREVVGAGATEGFVYREPSTYEASVIAKGVEVMGFVFGDAAQEIPVRIFKSEGKHKEVDARFLTETDNTLSLLLNESILGEGVRTVVESMYGEYLTMAGQMSEHGRDLVMSAKRSLIEEVLPKTGVVL